MPPPTTEDKTKPIVPFLQKLQAVAFPPPDPDTAPAHWSEDGTVFVVEDQTGFGSAMEGKYATIIRQLHFYGFQKLKEIGVYGHSKHSWAFKHPLFTRDNPEGILRIKRFARAKDRPNDDEDDDYTDNRTVSSPVPPPRDRMSVSGDGHKSKRIRKAALAPTELAPSTAAVARSSHYHKHDVEALLQRIMLLEERVNVLEARLASGNNPSSAAGSTGVRTSTPMFRPSYDGTPIFGKTKLPGTGGLNELLAASGSMVGGTGTGTGGAGEPIGMARMDSLFGSGLGSHGRSGTFGSHMDAMDFLGGGGGGTVDVNGSGVRGTLQPGLDLERSHSLMSNKGKIMVGDPLMRGDSLKREDPLALKREDTLIGMLGTSDTNNSSSQAASSSSLSRMPASFGV